MRASGGNRPKLTFIGWNERGPASIVSTWPPVMWPSSAPCAVVGGGSSNGLAEPFGGGEAACQQPDRGGFHIALAAGDLAGKAQPRLRVQPQRAVEQLRRIEEGVAVQAAEPRELGVLQPRNGAEDARLFAVLQLGLEADHVEQRAELVVLAKLHDRIGLDCGSCGLVRPNGFIGPWRSVSRPRSAITSIGRQPSK